MTRGWAIALGLVLWSLAMATSLGIAGAGHGWISPLVVTVPLAALYPLVLARAVGKGSGSVAADGAILIFALLLDVLLLALSSYWEPGGFGAALRFGAGHVASWIALWIGWQLLACVTFARRRGEGS